MRDLGVSRTVGPWGRPVTAQIFLSYARADQPRAEKLARALESAGYSVWWDRNLKAGARFTAEIDEALHGADSIVVLWSKQSVVSAWVQDEAAYGRDTGRLIPVLLDKVSPPLGFRQYQSVDFSSWSGRGKPESWPQLASALQQQSLSQPDAVASPRPPKERRLARWMLIAGASVLMLIAAGAAWMRFEASDSGLELAIAASRLSDPASREFAHQVALDLTRFQPADLETLSVLEGDQPQNNAAFRAQLGLSRDGAKLHSDVSLMVRGRPGMAWVDSLEGRADRVVDLRQQTASTLTNALGCAIKADAASTRLGDSDYRLFLKGCTVLSAAYLSFSSADIIPIFRKVTRSAPSFAPAQAMLALVELNAVSVVPPYQRDAFIREAKTALAHAKQLDPSAEETIAADSFHSSNPGQWSHAFPILDRGLRMHPRSALLLGLRADRLMTAGRMSEAAENTRQALQFDPLSPQTRVNFINALTYAGKLMEAQNELTKAEAIWPNSVVLEEARYRVNLRYGDARAALARLAKSGDGDVANQFDHSWENFLRARMDPIPAKVELALDSLRQRYRRDPADAPAYLQALVTFGRTDEAFEISRNPITLDSMEAWTDTLFRPHMRSLMIDPRFIDLAHRLGLLAFWKQSGVWPDFCNDPKLPYDCRKEAQKYP